jgi:hypothetical protein
MRKDHRNHCSDAGGGGGHGDLCDTGERRLLVLGGTTATTPRSIQAFDKGFDSNEVAVELIFQ